MYSFSSVSFLKAIKSHFHFLLSDHLFSEFLYFYFMIFKQLYYVCVCIYIYIYTHTYICIYLSFLRTLFALFFWFWWCIPCEFSSIAKLTSLFPYVCGCSIFTFFIHHWMSFFFLVYLLSGKPGRWENNGEVRIWER